METETTPTEATGTTPTPELLTPTAEFTAMAPGEIHVIRRNGKVTAFDADKISVAITKSFLAVEGRHAAASDRIHENVAHLSTQVKTALTRHLSSGGTIHIEDIQDQVELALMRSEHHKVARAYVLYREEHAQLRADKEQSAPATPNETAITLTVTTADGQKKNLDTERLRRII
ncbi:MAG: ATP cone domain-containing protein, partial [Methylococcales bacterium]